MSDRPSGLTALAVVNFVLGGFALLGVLGLVVATSADPEAAAQQGMVGDEVSMGMVYGWSLLELLVGGLLIASGLGYLRLKKLLGRALGNLYAFLAIVSEFAGLSMLGMDFSLLTLISIIYPVLTLALLNTVFRDDFRY